MPINIAMDGPVGAGKSSIADQVAKELSILHLDTGAMYRAIAIAVLRANADPQDAEACSRICEASIVDVQYKDGVQRTLLNGEDVTDQLRTPAVSAAASAVARWPRVRQKMVHNQQELAERYDMLIDGRDICIRVLPEARVKIYLTATPEERAKRRELQLREAGTDIPFQQVLQDVIARDQQDMTRDTDPLQIAPDAIVVDSTNLSREETVSAILRLVEEAYGKV